jgi:hypothetical protein
MIKNLLNKILNIWPCTVYSNSCLHENNDTWITYNPKHMCLFKVQYSHLCIAKNVVIRRGYPLQKESMLNRVELLTHTFKKSYWIAHTFPSYSTNIKTTTFFTSILRQSQRWKGRRKRNMRRKIRRSTCFDFLWCTPPVLRNNTVD